VLERFNGKDGKKGEKPVASLIECRLETGRTHQIRVHLAHAGHPLLGDATYGTGLQDKAARLPRRLRRRSGPWRQPCSLSTGLEHPTRGKAEFHSNCRGRLFVYTPVYPRLTMPALSVKLLCCQWLRDADEGLPGSRWCEAVFSFFAPFGLFYNAALRSG